MPQALSFADSAWIISPAAEAAADALLLLKEAGAGEGNDLEVAAPATAAAGARVAAAAAAACSSAGQLPVEPLAPGQVAVGSQVPCSAHPAPGAAPAAAFMVPRPPAGRWGHRQDSSSSSSRRGAVQLLQGRVSKPDQAWADAFLVKAAIEHAAAAVRLLEDLGAVGWP